MTADLDERRGGRGRAVKYVVAAGLYLAIVLWLTIGPVPWVPTAIKEAHLGVLNPRAWLTLSTWTGPPVEFILNVVLFFPVGVLASRLSSPSLGLALPIVLTIAIEIVQLPLAERVSDPRDLVANTLGAIAGLKAGRSVDRLKRARRAGHRKRSGGDHAAALTGDEG